MKPQNVTLSFEVSKAEAKLMDTFCKWADPEKKKFWDLNHYAFLKFQEGFEKDVAARKAHLEQVKTEKDAEKRRKEAQE